MRKWIDILNEFEKPVSDGGSLPPVADMDRGDGGNNGGQYWVGPNGKVVVEKDQYGGGDHAQMVYRNPTAFGLTRDDVLRELEPYETNYHHMKNWFDREDAGTHYSDYSRQHPDSSLGGRSLGQVILFKRGWIMVEYSPPEMITIWGSFEGIKRDIKHAVEHFPFMRCDVIRVCLYDGSAPRDWKHRVTVAFHKEDYPGFAGHVGALIDWVAGDKQPREHFIYLEKGAEVKHGFLHLSRGGEKGYFVPYLDENRGRHVRDRNSVCRVPYSKFPPNLKNDYSTIYGTILYSDKPFSVPTDVQTWNGRHWA